MRFIGGLIALGAAINAAGWILDNGQLALTVTAVLIGVALAPRVVAVVVRFARWFGREFAAGFRRGYSSASAGQAGGDEHRELTARLAADMRQVADRA